MDEIIIIWNNVLQLPVFHLCDEAVLAVLLHASNGEIKESDKLLDLFLLQFFSQLTN